MGDKAIAKATMINNKVPVVPGSDGVVIVMKMLKQLVMKLDSLL